MDLLEKYTDYLLIDVRDESEYRNGHIPGAINIPFDGLITNIKDQCVDRNQDLIVYCEKGFRSSKAYEKLKQIGYKNVHYFGSMKKYRGELEKGA